MSKMALQLTALIAAVRSLNTFFQMIILLFPLLRMTILLLLLLLPQTA